ncbi:MAG TPA: hypothetical protein VMM38_15160 [Aridibacter sp.]|nr:hypothetical protein [Aridibacter sp.]
MTAVAVWDHIPTSDELLEARLGRGWKPTASRFKEGDRVDGHAACLVTELDKENAQDLL